MTKINFQNLFASFQMKSLKPISAWSELIRPFRICALALMAIANLSLSAADAQGAQRLCETVFQFQSLDAKLSPELTLISRSSGGSNGGRWFLDDYGGEWFLKKDVRFPELQTSAEVISSEIYRFFGFETPKTKIVYLGSERYSAAKDTGTGGKPTNFSNYGDSQTRQLRVVAAYLRDWDRLGNQSNNLEFPDGRYVLLDFGGTLGSRAQGLHKPGPVQSDQIGSFGPETFYEMWNGFKVAVDPSHPWMKLNAHDVDEVISRFQALTNSQIDEIVRLANYSRKSDSQFMSHTLMARRDAMIEGLRGLHTRDR